VKLSTRPRPWLPPKSAFTGFRFPAEVIVAAVRWYLPYGRFYRDVEELLVERGIELGQFPRPTAGPRPARRRGMFKRLVASGIMTGSAALSMP
jgi:hypothetical protein